MNNQSRHDKTECLLLTVFLLSYQHLSTNEKGASFLIDRFNTETDRMKSKKNNQDTELSYFEASAPAVGKSAFSSAAKQHSVKILCLDTEVP